jgi:hypothetical protein
MPEAKATKPGYVNRNGQVVVRNIGLPGTDKDQSVYQLGWSECDHVCGANGSDIHLCLCPKWQGEPKVCPMRATRIEERTA